MEEAIGVEEDEAKEKGEIDGGCGRGGGSKLVS